MADDDKDSKTEEPTSSRLEESKKKGQVVSSREVGTAVLFMAALTLFIFQGEALWISLQGKMRFFIGGQISLGLNAQGVTHLVGYVIKDFLTDLAPFFILFVVVAILGNVLQHGFVLSGEPIKPKLNKISPLQGIKKLFSMRSLVELFKSILKMALVAIAVYLGMKDSFNQVIGLSDTNIPFIIHMMADDMLAVFWRVTIAFLIIAVIDFYYQKYEHIKGLRMTKQEVKDELKQMDGDPMVKGRIRQIQRELAQSRMMQEVPQADVVITNPTHVSVALKYTPGEMNAPKLVAKGKGPLALRIRELAKESDVPLVENPPLARTLYRDVELEQMVPPELFKAVAEVLAYVFGVKRAAGTAA
ncbi:flagellar biosynthesis protein FlhB [Magnetococcales bacterium HHB-1]